MPQDIFSEMASQVDWRLLARRLILRLAEEGGYQVDNINPREADNNIFEAVANVNNIDSQFVLQELRPKIQNEVSKEYRMTKDFQSRHDLPLPVREQSSKSIWRSTVD